MLTPTPQPQPPGRLPASVAEAVAEIRAKAGMDTDATNPLTTPIVDLFAPTVAAAKAGTRGVDLTAFDAAKASEQTTLADDIARQYPTVESIVRSVPLKPEQAAMVRNILGAAMTAPPGQMTGVQVLALKRAMLNAGFEHGIAGAIAMRAEALLRSKRGEGVLPQPRAAAMRRVRGQEMRRSMRTEDNEGPMLDFDAAVDVLEKARKQIETGPRGGKIVGYRTAGGKRTPVYEKPGAGASPSKGDEGSDDPKDAGGGEEAAEALRDHADAMEEQGAVASEVRKVAKRVEAAAKRKAKAAAAKAAADKLSEQAAEAGDEEAGTESEVEANQAQLAQMQRDDVEGAAGTGEAEPASQADKAPEKAPAASPVSDAEAAALNAPPGKAGVPSPQQRKTPTVDRDPVSLLGPEPDWDKIGSASNLTPEEALNRKETQEARKQYEAMFERLAAIEHQITSELVPMFNAIKNDIRRAVETNGRSIPRPKNAPKPMTPVEFLWEKVTAFIEFVGKMIASGARYAANKIKSIGGPKPPKGGDTEKSMRPVSEYHAALRKGGDGVSYLPTRILDGLFDVLRDAMAQDRMGEVAAAFASAYPYGADDGDGDEDDMRADERPPLLPSERRRQGIAASVTEFLSGLDDDDLEIPEDLALLFGLDGMEKGAGHKYIRRVPKPGGGYRYYYKVSGVTRDVGADLVEGAAFKLAADGKEGHFHVTGRDGDKVTLRHDESGKVLTVSAKALGAMLQREHAEIVGAKRESLKRDLAQAEKTGTAKQIARLRAEAERLGVGEAPARQAITMTDVSNRVMDVPGVTQARRWTKNGIDRLYIEHKVPGHREPGRGYIDLKTGALTWSNDQRMRDMTPAGFVTQAAVLAEVASMAPEIVTAASAAPSDAPSGPYEISVSSPRRLSNSAYQRGGQSRWWVQDDNGSFLKVPSVRGDHQFDVDMTLPPGTYTLGTGKGKDAIRETFEVSDQGEVFERSGRDGAAVTNTIDALRKAALAADLATEHEIPEALALALGFGDLEKGAGHKYIRRVPKAGGGFRYYYTQAAAARPATKGESVRVGDKVVEIGEVTPEGVEVDGKVMSHTDWLNTLSSHYAKLEADTLRRSVLYDRAVSRALRPGGLAGASPAKVAEALSGAMTRTGMTAESAARAVEWVVQRNGWADSAKGALLGEMTVGDRAKWVQQNYRKVASEAESKGGKVQGKQVADAVQKLAPAAAKVERPHAEMLAEALASAFPGKSFDDVVGMIRKAQTAEAAAKAPPKVDGDETSVYLPGKDGRPEKMPARYKLVEAGDLIASHDPESFSPRNDYPKGLQERAYHRDKAEQAKVRRNAASLIPEYVANTNPDAVNGAPLIDDNGVVLGGNSRTMSMQLAYKDGNGAGLKSFLEKNAQQFGLDAKDVAAMKSPVLVRVVDTKGRDPKLLVRQMNEGMTQDMDPRVMQVAMGRKLDEDAIGKLASDMDSDQTLSDFLDSPKAEPFIQDLRRVGIIDARNQSRYMRNGKLNADGKQLVERVLVGKVVGDPDLLSDTSPSVVTALAQAVPYMVQAEAHGKGYSLRDDLREALTAHNDMQRRNQAPKAPKDSSRAVDDYIRNADMFGGDEGTLAQGESPLVGNARARALTKVLFEKTGPRQLASVFRAYSDQANQNPEGQFSLFGAPKTPTEVFSDALAMAKSARAIEDIVQYAAEVAGDGADLMKSEGFTPPERVAAAAARGLKMREKVKGGTAVGVARARDLSNRKAVSLDTIQRMVSYFARHGGQVPDDKGTDANPSPWLVAWHLWGGDAGRKWAESIWERERGDTEKSARTLAKSISEFLADVGLSPDGADVAAEKPASRIAKSISEFLGPLAGDSGVLMPPGEYTVGTTAYGRRALPGGLLVDVEVPAGGVRRGVGDDGREWAVLMPADYGEFVGTMGTDGDPIDVFVGPDLGAPFAYIIGIQDPTTGLHDEDKVMFGFRSRDDAMACYRAAYDRRDLLMSVQRMSVPELQMWVERHGQSARRIAEGRPMRKGVSSAEVAAALASFGAVERVSTPLDTVLTSAQWHRAPNRLRGREGGEPVALGAIRRPALRSAPSAKPHVEPVLVIKSATPPAVKPAPAGARLAGLLAKGRR